MTGRARFGAFIAAGLTLALAVAVLASPQASSEPDGLERVAIDEGFVDAEVAHALEGVPTAGYGIEGIDDAGLGTGLAGAIGVAVTFTVAAALVALLRRRSRRTEPDSA